MLAISDKRLRELERAEDKLNALEAGGVDNWENYEDALKDYFAEDEHEEKMFELIDNLEVIFGDNVYEPAGRGAGIAFKEDVRTPCIAELKKMGVTFKKEG